MCNVFINKVQFTFGNEEGIVSEGIVQECLNDDTTILFSGDPITLPRRIEVRIPWSKADRKATDGYICVTGQNQLQVIFLTLVIFHDLFDFFFYTRCISRKLKLKHHPSVSVSEPPFTLLTHPVENIAEKIVNEVIL